MGREGIELTVLHGSSLSRFHNQVRVSPPFFNQENAVFWSGTVFCSVPTFRDCCWDDTKNCFSRSRVVLQTRGWPRWFNSYSSVLLNWQIVVPVRLKWCMDYLSDLLFSLQNFSHFTLIVRLLKKQPGVPASCRNHFDSFNWDARIKVSSLLCIC